MKAAYADNFVTAYCGDALEVMRGLPAGSVHCCVTSPPYWGLRDYGQDGQLGLERTPEEYVSRMVEYFRAVHRLLRKDGTLWLNLGDTYATFKGACKNPGGGEKSLGKHLKAADVIPKHRSSPNRMLPPGHAGLKTKDMVGIPWRLAFALQADGWYLRKDNIWNKPNPMPEPVTDRCTSSHEYMFHFTKSAHYFYDNVAISEPSITTGAKMKRTARGLAGQAKRQIEVRNFKSDKQSQAKSTIDSILWIQTSRNKRSVWTVATQPYPGAHYATFPPKLILPCILAGCPEGGEVLDPFAGTGTTGQVARETGRRAILIELNPDDIELRMKERFKQELLEL